MYDEDMPDGKRAAIEFLNNTKLFAWAPVPGVSTGITDQIQLLVNHNFPHAENVAHEVVFELTGKDTLRVEGVLLKGQAQALSELGVQNIPGYGQNNAHAKGAENESPALSHADRVSSSRGQSDPKQL